MENGINLSRSEKILLTLFTLSGSTRKAIRYEEIVIKAFESFPDDFHLKGYPQYPESGDLVHKPLYDFKKKGLVTAGNKMFALTERGIVVAETLKAHVEGKTVESTTRLSRDIEKEIDRLAKTSAFQLFVKGQKENILDTDFYEFLGVTVSTSRSDFLGRLDTLKGVRKAVKPYSQEVFKTVEALSEYMIGAFPDIIGYKTKGKN